MPRRWLVRAAWMAVGIASVYGISALAGAVSGGPLDPPYPPTAGTMKSIDSIAPSWFQTLPSDDGASCMNSRFFCVMSDEAVLDRETGLVWQRVPATCVNNCFWSIGYTNCVKAGTGGRQGWRMPGIEELQTLVDPVTHQLPENHPFAVAAGTYWSRTEATGDPGYAMVLDVVSGQLIVTAADMAVGPANPWCVRAPGGDG